MHELPGRANEQDLAPVSIYLDDGANSTGVEAAVTKLLYESGFQPFDHEPPVIGSWFRNFWARAREKTVHLTTEQLAIEIERKLRIELFDKEQAVIDNQEATGAAALIAALSGEDRACIRVGSLLVIKLDGHIFANNLTQYQLCWLERNQTLLREPERLLKSLDALPEQE